MREGKWKLIYNYEENHQELYDLGNVRRTNGCFLKKCGRSRKTGRLTTIISRKDRVNMRRADTTFDEVLAQQKHHEKIDVLLPRLEAQRLEFLFADFKPNATWWDSKVTKD